tara:strand:- start:13 stop:1179 length:1167 start_codon:yes stop_codon:yes gene_type:complete
MATTFKTFMNNDQVSTRTLLHESIPVTGTILSGTYADNNIKNYSHEMFQSVYDYPYLSSSANHILDITCGYAATSGLSKSEGAPGSAATVSVQNAKKINIYNQMAQVLVGHDITGAIQPFDRDGNIVGGGDKLNEVFFINFARLLSKDEIKKGSFSIAFNTGGVNTSPGIGGPAANGISTLYDTNAANDYRVNSPAGEYAILYTSSAGTMTVGTGLGLVFYQAGIIVITASFFTSGSGTGGTDASYTAAPAVGAGAGHTASPQVFGPRTGHAWAGRSADTLSGSNITASADALRNRLHNIQFNNTTELNSTVYFCRANHNDFNYSANPTYVTGSKIRIKNNMNDAPTSYITTVGLYSADNELLAVAKVSEPLKKDPTNELTLRVRLDY